jgi:hypothetical protein
MRIGIGLCAAMLSSCAAVKSAPPTKLDGGDDPQDLGADAATPGDLTIALGDLATPADLGPFPPGAIYQISVKATGQLLSVHNSATADGSTVEEQPAQNTPDQRWSVIFVTSSVYQILNGQSQTCLDVHGSSKSDGAAVSIWTCAVGADQQWTLQAAGGGFYNIVNVNSQSCLDLDNGNTQPGTVIFQYHCDGGDNQKWLFTRVQ